MNVLLPEREPPIPATNSPALMVRVMPRSAWTSTSPIRYVFVRSRVSTTGRLEGSTAPLLRSAAPRLAAPDDHLVAFREPVQHFRPLAIREPHADQDGDGLAVVELVDAARPPRCGRRGRVARSTRRRRRSARLWRAGLAGRRSVGGGARVIRLPAQRRVGDAQGVVLAGGGD